MIKRFCFSLLTLLAATAATAIGLTAWIKTRAELALDGYCPVSLSRDMAGKPGNSKFTACYRGQLFYFASPQRQQEFEADPKAHAPLMEGADVVLLFDEQRRAPGERRFGFLYSGRVFLFAGVDTTIRFKANPAAYLAHVQQAESRH